MRLTSYSWLDHEFIALFAEGPPGLAAVEATRELIGRCSAQLQSQGLSLDNTVRTRLFARDRQSREQGSTVRRELLANRARSASSSFIVPGLFNSQAVVALDLLAMRPSGPGAEKTMREYEPPRVPLRYLLYDSVVFLSGVTRGHATLAEQVADALVEIGESLADAGSSWERVVLISGFLHRGQQVSTLLQLLQQSIPAALPRLECEFVDGFASEGPLLELEVTAVR